MSSPHPQNASPIRLVIADDHPVFRSGLARALNRHAPIQVVGAAGSGEALVTLVREQHPHIALTDINMPGMCGVEATKIICREAPQTGVIALSMHTGMDAILRMLQAGAMGYLTKDCDEDEIVKAIHAVHGNDVYYCAAASARIVQNMASNQLGKPGAKQQAHLSERDREVMRLMCQERGSKEIASALNISCRSVDGVRQRIQERIGARNMVGIALYAIRNGIFQP